jgi:hypothetical protein
VYFLSILAEFHKRGTDPLGSRISEEIVEHLGMSTCSTGGARYAPGFNATL